MPFDPSDDYTWWPNPWPPRTGPAGGSSYPYDWTDPFINLRAATPNPFASAPDPFTAAALGAMAWHPPIFLNNGSTSVPSNLSATTWPQQPFSPAGPTATLGLDNVPGWPQSILAPLAQLGPPDAPRSMDQPTGLFSRNPALRYGLFGWDPDPTSPFASEPLGAGGFTAAVPTTLGTPGATHTLGLGPRLPLLAPFQSPVEASAPAFDPLIGPASSPDGPAAAPPRSVLFNRPPVPWGDLGARERDLHSLDQSAQSLDASGLPLSKSGAPYVPPPPPQLSITPEQGLAFARWLSPNLVDYFTKTLPPAPSLPSTPGKIPGLDNPYALGAAFEAATSLLPEDRAAAAVAGAVKRGATEAAVQAAKAAADSPALTRAAEQFVTGRYGTLRGTLPPGFQANHLNQDAVYGDIIPRNEGLSVGMRGNAFSEPGTSHFVFHQSMEQFWDQYRRGGNLFKKTPTNAQYGEALQRSLVAGGLSPTQASELSAQAATQRAAYGLSEISAVPRIPGRINQGRP
jgi:hypothetical protein